MNKPLCLEMEEAEKELNRFVEQLSKSHGLPCYLLEPVVSKVLARLENGKRLELEEAKKAYEKEESQCQQ